MTFVPEDVVMKGGDPMRRGLNQGVRAKALNFFPQLMHPADHLAGERRRFGFVRYPRGVSNDQRTNYCSHKITYKV